MMLLTAASLKEKREGGGGGIDENMHGALKRLLLTRKFKADILHQ